MDRKTRETVNALTGTPANLRNAWRTMEGAVLPITLTLVTNGRTRDEATFRFGKNVRNDLAAAGIPTKFEDPEVFADMVARSQLALDWSAKKLGKNFIHRNAYVQIFQGAKGAKIADAANRVAGHANTRAKVQRVLKDDR